MGGVGVRGRTGGGQRVPERKRARRRQVQERNRPVDDIVRIIIASGLAGLDLGAQVDDRQGAASDAGADILVINIFLRVNA